MKRIVLIIVAMLAAISLSSCGTKSQPEATSKSVEVDPIVGKWELTKLMGGDGETETFDISDQKTIYTFDQDGTMAGVDNGKAVSGTWKEIDDSLYVVTINSSDLVFTLENNSLINQVNIEFGEGTELNFIFERK